MPKTPMTNEEYVAEHGTQCPFCKSANLSHGDQNFEGDTMYQEVHCGDCQEKWDDAYDLNRYLHEDNPDV